MSTLLNIKKLREETGAGIMDARKALEESEGDLHKARVWLSHQAVTKALKKADRTMGDGAVFSYVHQTRRVAAMVKLGCETDFVARTEDFQKLGKEIAMQVASINPSNVNELLGQSWIRDQQKTIGQLLKEHVAKFGENIQVLEFVRMEI